MQKHEGLNNVMSNCTPDLRRSPNGYHILLPRLQTQTCDTKPPRTLFLIPMSTQHHPHRPSPARTTAQRFSCPTRSPCLPTRPHLPPSPQTQGPRPLQPQAQSCSSHRPQGSSTTWPRPHLPWLLSSPPPRRLPPGPGLHGSVPWPPPATPTAPSLGTPPLTTR